MRFRFVLVSLFLFSISLSTIWAQGSCDFTLGNFGITPSSIDFGSVNVGSTSAVKTISITTTDSVYPVEVGQINITNPVFQFVSLPQLPYCVYPGQSLQVQIYFQPTTSGTEQGKVVISGSAPTVKVSLTGVGLGSQVTVTPTSLDFGTVPLGGSAEKSFRILNSGNVQITIDGANLSNRAYRIKSPSFPRSIPGGGSLQVTVLFTPVSSGASNGNLTLISGGNTLAVIRLFGAGGRGVPDITLSAKAVDFGLMDVGTFKTGGVDIGNNGNAPLEILSATGDRSIRILSPQLPFIVDPGKKRTLKFRFICPSDSSVQRTLVLNTNDPDEKSVSILLTATGVQGLLGFVDRSISSNLAGNSSDTSGVQMIDYNNDGKQDLYLTGPRGNFLYKNLGGGKFTNVTKKTHLSNHGRDCRGASWADADNDGDLDVFVANFDVPSLIFKNNKNVFSPVSVGSSLVSLTAQTTSSQGGIWLDYNNDGRVDLYVVRDGAPNQLFRSQGLFNYVDVASAAGVAYTGPGRSAVAADFNNDGYQDIYLVNYFRPNKLYINNKDQTFRDATSAARVGFSGASVQAVVSDYDGDGDIDIFVVNSDGPQVLYKNTGNARFVNATASAGLQGPQQVTGASFSDFDLDGDQDLILTQRDGANIFYKNNGKGRFIKVTNVDVSSTESGSVSTGDTDNDGDADVIATDGEGEENGDSSFENTGGEGNNWLTLILQGTKSNRSAIGAKVILRTGLIFQAQVVTSGNGKSQESLPLEFGLGKETIVTSIQIFWPSGIIQTLTNVAVNQRLKVIEP